MAKDLLNCSSAEYFARPEVNNSSMKCFRQAGPWSYYHNCECRSISEPKRSDAMRIGSLFHKHMECLTLGEQLIDHCHVLPAEMDGEPINNRKPAHREYLSTFKEDAENSNTVWATEAEVYQVLQMCETSVNSGAAKDLMSNAGTWPESVAVNRIEDVDVKAMSDLYHPVDGVLVDFKTTRCADSSAFTREAIFKYGYHFQAAHYCDVFEAKQFFIIAVRNFEPYETMVYEVPPALIEEAREINHETLRQIRDCRELGTWHSPGWGKVITLEKDYDKK